MHWSLSEFLNLLHARGQCWGLVELGAGQGLRIRGGGTVLFYHVLAGEVTVTGDAAGPFALRAGESAFVVANAAHAVRTHDRAVLHTVPFLENDEYADCLHHAGLGTPAVARVLCGRLKVRWPGGIDSRYLPQTLRIAADPVVRLDVLVNRAGGEGAAALFTRAAALLLSEALRDDPRCRQLFLDAGFRDPVSHAIQLMEIHLHRPWTIATLAAKIGMARSSFAARFLAEQGKPPIAVLTDMRMERAALMLAHTPLKISEVAERVGYQSQAAFCRRFAGHFGTTPARMRAAGGLAGAGSAGASPPLQLPR